MLFIFKPNMGNHYITNNYYYNIIILGKALILKKWYISIQGYKGIEPMNFRSAIKMQATCNIPLYNYMVAKTNYVVHTIFFFAFGIILLQLVKQLLLL